MLKDKKISLVLVKVTKKLTKNKKQKSKKTKSKTKNTVEEDEEDKKQPAVLIKSAHEFEDLLNCIIVGRHCPSS